MCINAWQDWKSFACDEDFYKKHRAAATLIRSHESIKQQPHKSAAMNQEIKITTPTKKHFNTATPNI